MTSTNRQPPAATDGVGLVSAMGWRAPGAEDDGATVDGAGLTVGVDVRSDVGGPLTTGAGETLGALDVNGLPGRGWVTRGGRGIEN